MRLLVIALLAGCGASAPIAETDLLLSITPGALEVEPGQPFPLTVTRVWKKDLVPAEWSDKALAPLALKLEEETRREDGTRVEETRRYTAHAFSLKDVVVRPVKLTAKPKDGGADRKVTATGFRIRVNPVLDPLNPGPPELPGDPPRSRSWIWWTSVAVLCMGLVLLVSLRRRPSALPEPPKAPEAPAPPSAREHALARLRGATAEEAADIVREYVARTRGIRALERTTEELLPALPKLADVLAPADLAKFAAQSVERDRVVAAAEAFVREDPS